MTRSNRDWARVAAAQAGVFTTLQAKAAGISAWECRRRARAGLWLNVGRGVYTLAGSAASWEQTVWIACLETRGLASHRTAGRLWGLDGVDTRAAGIDVIVPISSRRASRGATVHRSRTLGANDRYQGRGIPRTNLPRTLLDLSEVLTFAELELAVDSAIRHRPYLLAWLRRMLVGFETRGHHHIGRLKDLISAEYRSVDSAFEVKLRRWLRAMKLPQPDTGHPVKDGGKYLAKLDFAWPDNRPRVGLMAQSVRWHGNTTRWKIDLSQGSRLAGLGWRVLQCSVDDLRHRPTELLLNLRRALAGFDGSRDNAAAPP